MKKSSIIIIIVVIIGVFFAFLLSACGLTLYYFKSLEAVDTNSQENINFTVKVGEATNTIITNLKKSGLIKSDLTMKIYAKLNPGTPQAGDYILTKGMTAKEIYESIISGKVTHDTKWVTFVEGKRLTYYAEVISNNFDYSKEEVLKTLDDKEYIKTLIDKYDFLSDDILNEKIYHPLEGYLFADTYEFMSNISLKGIIERMLDETESKLSGLIDEIEASEYSVHELMTLASIVELEGARSKDREGVAGVFYNRLKSGWTLGSDVTTYYAVGKDFQRDLTWDDLNSCNEYNTRGTCVKGLPVGPIASPSFESIKATISPTQHDFYYFVADKEGKTYFNKTQAEHDSEVARLKREGKWFEY